MKYNITYTVSEVGSIDVEADDPDEAMDLAREEADTWGADHVEFDRPVEYESDENMHRIYKR